MEFRIFTNIDNKDDMILVYEPALKFEWIDEDIDKTIDIFKEMLKFIKEMNYEWFCEYNAGLIYFTKPECKEAVRKYLDSTKKAMFYENNDDIIIRIDYDDDTYVSMKQNPTSEQKGGFTRNGKKIHLKDIVVNDQFVVDAIVDNHLCEGGIPHHYAIKRKDLYKYRPDA